jgi:hypothetical protein
MEETPSMKRTSLSVVAGGILASLVVASAASAATTTFGSLAPDYTGTNLGCNGCEYFQTTVSSGPSYAAPHDGMITEFHMQIGSTPDPTESVVLTVVRADGGSQFKLVAATPTTNISATPAHSIATIPAGLAVNAGDTIGLKYNTAKTQGVWSPSGSTPADEVRHWGGAYTAGSTYTPDFGDIFGGKRLNLEAVLSYTPAPPPPTTTDATAPVITSLKSKYTKFRVNFKGVVLIAKVPRGTKLTYSTSEAASVSFSVSRAITSAKTKKTTFKLVHGFKRSAIAGLNSVAYSGRYLDAKGKKRALKIGKYKLTATPVDAAGNVGAPQSVSFKVTA